MDDAAIAAFREAESDRLVRGVFRLGGVLAGVAIAFILSLAQLEVWHEQLYVLALAPVLAFPLLGETVVRLHRWLRAPRIPRARLVHR
jgi:hypothetical protein